MNLRLLWRRLRGLLTTAIVWAGAWTGVGLLVGAWFWLSGESLLGLTGPAWLVPWAKIGAVMGAVTGGSFALAVMTLGRRRELNAISPLYFGGLGAVSTAIVTMTFFPAPLTWGLAVAAIGFICGSGSVVIARRALPSPRSTEALNP